MKSKKTSPLTMNISTKELPDDDEPLEPCSLLLTLTIWCWQA